ncbi:MAG: low temperature requirement protein A [Actinomycetota bacterium]|nr:low temperature requirement protein A [Rubrobacteraceae bacterium]MBA3634813.1 low temperature requirement protein A [Rubrobacteraceae bacterium]MBA3702033.1 low temperature requirement protein A [Rubrobacteraceae bacterium]MDQ3182898.1 low temperature requirement protein A [Actinomycetota bacterium]MDQ3495922.1 low temperature requirement protein A [Actinomycetota bacterium]
MRDLREPEGLRARLLRPQVLRDPSEEHRTSTWLELFFDLCFVVAVAALARGLHHDPTFDGALHFAAFFVPVWWAWMGFTWYATAFDNDDVVYRATLLGAMLCILWLAASISGLYKGETLSFVLAYVAMKSLLVGLYARAWRDAANVRLFVGLYAVGNAAGAMIWLSSLLVPAPGRYGIWALALLVELVTPMLAVRASFRDTAYAPRVFHPEHIPERYGLFTLIVLGESVLAVAAGTAGTGWYPAVVATGVFGFVIAACIWWLYFDYVGSSGLQISPRASFFWGYGHLPIYAGIAASGVGILLAIEGAAETTAHGDRGARVVLGGGLAVYLLAVSFIHWVNRGSLDDRALFARLATAALLILVVPLGFFISPLVFTALTALVMLALTTFETLSTDVPGDPPAG